MLPLLTATVLGFVIDGSSYGVESGVEFSMKVHMMEDKVSEGAVCLDGTTAGFYMSNGTGDHVNDWIIYFEGGGWCFDEPDCYGRSLTKLGSSAYWATSVELGGIMSNNCSVSPDFCQFNRVYLAYCDGNSFAGNRDEPIVVNDTKLYFRGKRIMDAAFDTLRDSFGLKNARNVLLTGCSAGGLAAYLHTEFVYDYMKQAAPSMEVFKSAPISGYFLMRPNVTGYPVIVQEMQKIFKMQNSTSGLSKRCLQAYPNAADHWRCAFANESYVHIQVPIFVLNSGYDFWQTKCIYTSTLRGNPKAEGTCGAGEYAYCQADPDNCTNAQMAVMNNYITEFNTDISTPETYEKAGNGAFIHSCHTHCEAQFNSHYNTFAVNGVTIQEAVSKWWNSVGEPAAKHSYTPCYYYTDKTPRDCNPTCVAK